MMKILATAIIVCQWFLASFAFAHGPTPQKIDEVITIEAPISAVWKEVSDFKAIVNWHPDVIALDTPEEGMRTITLKDKGKLTESLDEVDENQHLIGYRLYEENIEAFPVSYYGISITLSEVDEGTKLNWQGRFYRADTGNFPPEKYNDETAVKAMQLFAQTGMQSLKKRLESK